MTNNRLGIVLILLSFASFPVSNAATRYIVHTSSIPLSMYFSYVKFFAVLILLIFGLVAFRKAFFSVKNKKIVFIRCMILMVNNICLTISLSYLPLDIFYSIVFIMPLMTTIMGVFLLKERFTYINLLALVIGFAGILIIVQPNSKETFALIGVICTIVTAITGALSGVIARKYLSEENPYSATFYVAICSFLLGIIMVVIDGNFNLAQDYLSWNVSAIIFLSALFTIVASSLYMKAYQISNVTVIAPAQYTQLIWGILLGYLIFNDSTTTTTLLGCAIIIFATVFNFYVSKGRKKNEVIVK